MPRLGIQFEKPAPAVQASLDRYVFALIRRKAAAKRPLQAGAGAERRMAPRVEIGDAEQLTAVLLLDRPRATLLQPKPAEGQPLKVVDISTTGCGAVCPDGVPVQANQRIRLRLTTGQLSIELSAKIVYVG